MLFFSFLFSKHDVKMKFDCLSLTCNYYSGNGEEPLRLYSMLTEVYAGLQNLALYQSTLNIGLDHALRTGNKEYILRFLFMKAQSLIDDRDQRKQDLAALVDVTMSKAISYFTTIADFQALVLVNLCRTHLGIVFNLSAYACSNLSLCYQGLQSAGLFLNEGLLTEEIASETEYEMIHLYCCLSVLRAVFHLHEGDAVMASKVLDVYIESLGFLDKKCLENPDASRHSFSTLWLSVRDLHALARLFAVIVNRMLPKHSLPWTLEESLEHLTTYIQDSKTQLDAGRCRHLFTMEAIIHENVILKKLTKMDFEGLDKDISGFFNIITQRPDKVDVEWVVPYLVAMIEFELSHTSTAIDLLLSAEQICENEIAQTILKVLRIVLLLRTDRSDNWMQAELMLQQEKDFCLSTNIGLCKSLFHYALGLCELRLSHPKAARKALASGLAASKHKLPHLTLAILVQLHQVYKRDAPTKSDATETMKGILDKISSTGEPFADPRVGQYLASQTNPERTEEQAEKPSPILCDAYQQIVLRYSLKRKDSGTDIPGTSPVQ
eukprot:TRINITY_DN7032_c0_g1_i4.p1 TRINITY_DN7032_c0_g1~~TRINITY_DN7032_c0_g1_i4.p1  ORF type:complete len:550 (-),score=84.83 TRINITY_DN7032_c0_g1_i4:88-1737(-)